MAQSSAEARPRRLLYLISSVIATAPLLWVGCSSEAPATGASEELTQGDLAVETAAIEAQALRDVFPDHASVVLDQHARFEPIRAL